MNNYVNVIQENIELPNQWVNKLVFVIFSFI